MIVVTVGIITTNGRVIHARITFIRMNLLLATARMPTIPILGGTTMGGGAGISTHGQFCASECVACVGMRVVIIPLK